MGYLGTPAVIDRPRGALGNRLMILLPLQLLLVI